VVLPELNEVEIVALLAILVEGCSKKIWILYTGARRDYKKQYIKLHSF
jgi:hypothetical protein